MTNQSFEAIEGNSKRAWRFDLDAENIRIVPLESGESLEFTREAAQTAINVVDGLILRRLVTFPEEETKPVFRLPKEHFQQLLRWLGPPSKARLAAEIRRRTRALIPIAFLFVLTALPCPGEASGGANAVPLDIMGMTLGLGLILIFIIGRFKPHRLVFLLDALWWMGLATDNFHSVSNGQLGGFGLALAVVALVFSFSALKLFALYKPWPDPQSPPA